MTLLQNGLVRLKSLCWLGASSYVFRVSPALCQMADDDKERK
jgi:hypothetical protein